MTYVIDNGNANPLSKGDQWTPVLSGDVFCSLACGCRCKKADFDTATALANAYAVNLGPGWNPDVWENGGWHWEVKKGPASVRSSGDGRCEAYVRFMLDDIHESCVRGVGKNPREAVEAVVGVLNAKVAILKRTLVSVSVGSAEIEDIATLK